MSDISDTTPTHWPISQTSVRHFRYMSDISDTCPRQLTDVRDICQTFQIYVGYIRHLSWTIKWCLGHLWDTSDICRIYQTPVLDKYAMSRPSVRHFRYMSDISDTCPKQISHFRDICQTLQIYVQYIRHPPTHWPISRTFVSPFRYMFDISHTCPRQLPDVSDICQTLQIYLRYVRHLSKPNNQCQWHLSDTSDIGPIYQTPLVDS
jgi:hypothetical protein